MTTPCSIEIPLISKIFPFFVPISKGLKGYGNSSSISRRQLG